jgi:hypothetical protein
MDGAEAQRAVRAAIAVATEAGLDADGAVILNSSIRLVARLLPCDTVARVSPAGWFSASNEVELARRLAQVTDDVIAGLDPRVEPRVVAQDGFEIALWSYVDEVQSRPLPSADYARGARAPARRARADRSPRAALRRAPRRDPAMARRR